MPMFSKALVSVLALSGAGAVRQRRQGHADTEGTGVGSLYTFGGPKVSAPALRNPQSADGCFPGLRVVNEDKELITTDVDLVSALLGMTKYRHVRQNVVKLMDGGEVELHDCGWKGNEIRWPSLEEHMIWNYVKRAKQVPKDVVPNLATVAAVGLSNSYTHNISEVAEAVKAEGWGLVSSAVIGSSVLIMGKEAAHLTQDPSSLRCLLTFEGSDDVKDFIEDAQVIRVPFCGLEQKVHRGFVKVVMEMVSSTEFQNEIRPKLPYCNKVDILGHSLGGATASLFAACASNPLESGADGFDEYKHFSWTPVGPKKMKYV